MAKCRRCGKGGLFHKVGPDGYCKNCSTTTALEQEQEALRQNVAALNEELNNRTRMYEKVKEELRNEILPKIHEESRYYDSRIALSKQELEKLNQELQAAQEKVEKSNKTLKTNENRVVKLKEMYQKMDYVVKAYLDSDSPDHHLFADNLLVQVDQVLSPTVILNLNCLNVRQLRSLFKKNESKIQDVVNEYTSHYTTKSNIAIYKLMVIALEAELQNTLYELRYGKLDNAVQNVKTITQKYYEIAVNANQTIAPTMKKFIGEIEYLFIEAVKIEYEYYTQRERMKEEQKALKEKMREEAAERKLLEQQKQQVEKEEQKYKNEMDNIGALMKAATDTNKLQQLQKRLEELQNQLNAVKTKKDEIINLQNGKAGCVYVISNLGSFGENVFKVGMTRRLEPMDRVNELGNASVPFPFDVHSFIFSDNAVELEHKIHVILNDKRVNRVNLRKEFFHISLNELENLINSLDPTAEFNRTMLAEEYKQSLSTDTVPEELASEETSEDLEDIFVLS